MLAHQSLKANSRSRTWRSHGVEAMMRARRFSASRSFSLADPAAAISCRYGTPCCVSMILVNGVPTGAQVGAEQALDAVLGIAVAVAVPLPGAPTRAARHRPPQRPACRHRSRDDHHGQWRQYRTVPALLSSVAAIPLYESTLADTVGETMPHARAAGISHSACPS